MGSPISPCIANLFMEEFEVKALRSCSNPPTLWLRFVDDTFVITKAEHSKPLLQHISNQDPHIQFTVEEPTQQGTLPFLDTIVSIEPSNTFTTSIYRKPTHRDQYLNWDSNHFITTKQTLAHRAKVVSSNQEALDKEVLHIRKALQTCPFSNWALNQLQHKAHRRNQPNQHNSNINSSTNNNNNTSNKNMNITIVVPYIQSIREKFKKICKAKGIKVHFKGTNTLRTLLVMPKDKDPKLNKSGVIYHFKCPHISFPEAYTGESGRALGDRIKDHLKVPSPIHHHSRSTGHPLSPECFNIIHWETQGSSRNIKEAMFIRVNDPSLNRNLGKYQLPHIWDNILKDTPMPQVKQSNLSPYPYWYNPFPRLPNLPLTPHHQPKVEAHVLLVISSQMGVPKHPQTSLHPLPMFPLLFLIQQHHLGTLCQFYCLV